MKGWIRAPTSVAQWYTLLQEVSASCRLQPLLVDHESYLIFLLERFSRRHDLPDVILGEEFLLAHQLVGGERQAALRDVGDKCLLYAGFFPERTIRLHVSAGYFVLLGRSAYADLAAQSSERSTTMFYQSLSDHFVGLVDVLLEMRYFADPGQCFPVGLAYELWAQTDSQYARECINSGAYL